VAESSDLCLSDWTLRPEDHLALRGLLNELPPVGAVFPDENRDEWIDAVVKLFALLYERDDGGAAGG
jgi:hypothetical protein